MTGIQKEIVYNELVVAYREEAFRVSSDVGKWRTKYVRDVTLLLDELTRLRAAVEEHHSQKSDDRCWMDDTKLYEAFGLPECDRSVGSSDEMLENCKRYILRRCTGGGPWKTYKELEEENAGLKARVNQMDTEV